MILFIENAYKMSVFSSKFKIIPYNIAGLGTMNLDQILGGTGGRYDENYNFEIPLYS